MTRNFNIFEEVFGVGSPESDSSPDSPLPTPPATPIPSCSCDYVKAHIMDPTSHQLELMDIYVSHAEMATCPECRAIHAEVTFLADLLQATRRRRALVRQALAEASALHQNRVSMLQAIDQSTSYLRHYMDMEAASLHTTYVGTIDCLEQDVDLDGEENGNREGR
ncbi:hypothetical protein GCK32_008769 [Trichostrongylus colubriformis]|uniref:Uncharacterized protein n=1 Tax=Trichostrongylus colubriformis TaxID=6319 RepID=A0AAN8G9B0_TRICO